MTLTRKIRRFAALSWRERFLFLEASLTLLAVRLMLQVQPVRALRQAMRPHDGKTDRGRAEAIVRIAWMATAQQVGDGPCLRRSITVQRLLRRRGLEAQLRIGGLMADKQLRGHAWVEVDGLPVGDPVDIGTLYKPFGISPEASALWVVCHPERSEGPGRAGMP